MLAPEPSAEALAVAVRAGVLDAELAALTWLTIEAGLPLVVAGEPGGGRRALRDALVDLLPAGIAVHRLAGEAETFAWMPEAIELGWRHEGSWGPASGAVDADPADGAADGERARADERARVEAGSARQAVMIADLEPDDAGGAGRGTGTWADHARVAVRALAVGYGMAAIAGGARLEDVLGRLAAAPVNAIDDELTRLGVVLILGLEGDGVERVVAAHLMRPVARDVHGHIKRLPPAVLATWNPLVGRWDHFAWGVLGELAGRTGRRPVELEREQAVRASQLAALAADPGPRREPGPA
jgi:hypothetical protein